MKGDDKVIDDNKVSKENEVEQCDYICVHEEIIEKVEQQMPSDEMLIDLADFFKVFGDTTRIKILYVLFQSERCVCVIANLLHRTQTAKTHHRSTKKPKPPTKTRRQAQPPKNTPPAKTPP
ncbi:hypothetical protein CG709_12345, partial [Lachnotalea glycerini]